MKFETLQAHILDVHAMVIRLSSYSQAFDTCMRSTNQRKRINGCTAVQLTASVSSLLDRAANQFGYQISDLHGRTEAEVRDFLTENRPDIERQFMMAFPSMASMFGLTPSEMEQSLLLTSLSVNSHIEELLDEIERLITDPSEAAAVAVVADRAPHEAANDERGTDAVARPIRVQSAEG